jgi:hypothetical protein
VNILTFLTLEAKNGDRLIIEFLDSPHSFEVSFNDAEKWQSIMITLNADAETKMYDTLVLS